MKIFGIVLCALAVYLGVALWNNFVPYVIGLIPETSWEGLLTLAVYVFVGIKLSLALLAVFCYGALAFLVGVNQ